MVPQMNSTSSVQNSVLEDVSSLCAQSSQRVRSTQLEDARLSPRNPTENLLGPPPPPPFPTQFSLIPSRSICCTHFDCPRMCRMCWLPTQAEGQGWKAVLWELRSLFAAGNLLWNWRGHHGVPLAYVSNGFNTSSLDWLTLRGVGEGREKPIKCWLSVNVRKEVRQQKEPGHMEELFCLALFWISKLTLPFQSQGYFRTSSMWQLRGEKVNVNQPVSFCIGLWLFLKISFY